MTTAPARGRRAAGAVGRPARKAPAGVQVAAADLPVARVLVDVPLAHLDRPYDYLVAEQDGAAARPGARIRVRFAGRLVGGYILERLAASDHEGRLGFVERVVSAEPVLSAEVAQLARAVADRYAGSVADVLRLAVPPRHAKVEAQEPGAQAPGAQAPGGFVAGPAEPGAGGGHDVGAGWSRYVAGGAFLGAVRDGRAARAVWQAVPGEDWAARLAEAAAAAAGSGRGVLLIVPDARDLARLDTALTAALIPGTHVTLSADLGPAERYRRFLAVSRGSVRVVAGTRAAVFAPVRDLGLLAVFDDGDDLLAEPRAPYPHAREVLMLRSAARSCALLVGGYARTAEAQLLVESGWAQQIVAARAEVRQCSPRIEAAGDDYAVGADSAAARARLTPAAFSAARQALATGAPVLVQVPRRGYLPGLACARCGRRAQCRHCGGPLGQAGPSPSAGSARPAAGVLGCRWCGRPEAHFHCAACGFERLRATAVGAGRTAEEIGRAFPGVAVINSSGPRIRATVPDEPLLVVATPGAEPVAAQGYGAALLLDGGVLLGRPDLRAAEETLRRWMAGAAMVRPAAAGGRVVIGADGSLPAVQALIRWDPVGHAAVELAARRELGFPPAVAMASLQGGEAAVLAAIDRLELPARAEVLGPVALDDLGPADPGPAAGPGSVRQSGSATVDPDTEDGPILRALIRAPQADRKALGAALHTLSAGRSVRKEGGGLRIHVDPLDLF